MNESNVSLVNISFDYCKYDKHYTTYTDLEKTAKHSAFVFLIVLGISLNVFVIILAAKFTVRRNLHHLIINMAISDALFLFVRFWDYLPWMSDLKWRIHPSGILGVIFCKTKTFLFYGSYMVSFITLLIISIERFKATSQSLQRPRQYTLKHRLLIIGLSWLIPTPFAAFYATLAKLYLDGKVCDFSFAAQHTFAILISNSFVIAILGCVIFFLSILVIRRLTKPQSIENHLSEGQQSERARRTKAAVRMVLASLLLYICCWIPLYVYSFLLVVNIIIPSPANEFLGCINKYSCGFIVYTLLPVINSCFSPCIYIVFLSDFRQAAKKIFCRKNTANQAPQSSNSFEIQPVPRNGQEEDIEL